MRRRAPFTDSAPASWGLPRRLRVFRRFLRPPGDRVFGARGNLAVAVPSPGGPRIFTLPARIRRFDAPETVIYPLFDSIAIVGRVVVPVVLVMLALTSAAAVAWGTHPHWAQYPAGLEWIMMARRLQWPLATLCVLCCVGLITLAVSGRRRAWWLLVLAPVVLLFYQRFAGEEFRRMGVLDHPSFVWAHQAAFLKDDSRVVGVVFEGVPYAYPCGALHRTPVVVHADADKRLMLMWNPYAGRAVAYAVEHTIKPREIDIVSMPANAMLLYNGRIGQFINAFTGLTPSGQRPGGFVSAIETSKMSWGQWRTAHPDTRVMSAPMTPAGENPRQIFTHRPVKVGAPLETRVSLVATARPAAIRLDGVGADPLNLTIGDTKVLLVRDHAGRVRAFDRSVKGDLFPKFQRRTIGRRSEVALIDSDTESVWTIDGRCVGGFAKGQRLRAIWVEDDLPLGVLASYYPDLEFVALLGFANDR